MEPIRVHQSKTRIEATEFDLEESRFSKGSLRNSRLKNIMMNGTVIDDVNASHLKIINANLSDLEIEGAQLGGAYLHNIGMPPKDHPFYVEGATMRPVRFEDCALAGSRFLNCDLTGVEISDCNISGLRINGVLIEDLLANK
ncbi:MAG TPA: pentapeptide repeat-containing protein [Puia sp.]|nr:pentapeptide repeat-containing protein [Puia sp.]